jgi:hypothetical protein
MALEGQAGLAKTLGAVPGSSSSRKGRLPAASLGALGGLFGR